MKNKDLFEAIDKIDEDFVNDAGKYLHSDFIDNNPVEVRPAVKKTSPIKFAAPIAAAMAVVLGAALIAVTQRPSTNRPESAAAAGRESAPESSEADDTSSDTVSDNEASSTPENSGPSASDQTPDGDFFGEYNFDDLPVGPDGKKLTADNIGTGIISQAPKPSPDIVIKYGIQSVQCKFAYYAVPSGANYNSADNPEAFADGFTFKGSTEYERVYDDRHDGDDYGNFNVSTAVSSFIWASEDSDELVYNGSDLELSRGSTFMEDVYIVKKSTDYYLIARNGETHLPSLNIQAQKDGGYSLMPYSGNISGLEYITETPPMILEIDAHQKAALDQLFDKNSYIKARVRISDVLYHEDKVDYYDYSVSVDARAYIKDVISVQSGGYEPKDVAAFINTQTSASELKTALMKKFGFTDVRVWPNFTNKGLETEFTEDILVPGNAVTVYDENGLCGIYTYGDHK